MVRTKAESSSVKASGAKAPRKVTTSAQTSNSATGASDGKGKQQNAGGNPYCPRETPPWQKEITKFFKTNPKQNENNTKMDEDHQEASGS
ncbi:hypothetical protein L9F63_000266 [Diploptera punctata]|uniref:PCNA-associated factor n=1 Tax=Diploptera punctata TaxID=6984 RepID=A0AAD8APN7_DIPPU|nr:hypothetical protein L9F63_000266 [Diploptera punctata]